MSSNQSLRASLGRCLSRISLLWVFGLGFATLKSSAADLFDEKLIPSIRIEIPEEGVDILRAYRWKWGGNDEERTNVFATVYEDKTVYTNVAIHLKGSAGSFRPFDDRPGLTLNFGKNGSPQRFHGLEKLHLNNSVQDPSYISEVLARGLCAKVGLPVTRASHCLVNLNGRNVGLYVLVEGWTKPFLKRQFGDAKGQLFDGGFARDIDQELLVNSSEKAPDLTRIRALLAAAKTVDPKARLATLEKLMEVDRFHTLIALEVLLAHWDGYSIGHNNYRIYDNPTSGRLVFLPHGMDQLFGVYRSTPEYSIQPRFKSITAQAVTSTREGRMAYLQRLGTLYTNHFADGQLLRQVDEVAERLAPVLGGNGRRMMIWSNAVSELKNRIQRRVVSVADQLAHPRQPLAIAENAPVVLKAWAFKTDSTGGATAERSLEDGSYVLKIHSGSGTARTWASWRRTEFLDEGVYELHARVRFDPSDATAIGAAAAPRIALRLSGERDSFPTHGGTQWQELVHTFALSGPTEVEMLCELRGTAGTALIKAESLRLVRRSTSLDRP